MKLNSGDSSGNKTSVIDSVVYSITSVVLVAFLYVSGECHVDTET